MTRAYMVVRRKKGSRTNQHSCGKEGLFNLTETRNPFPLGEGC